VKRFEITTFTEASWCPSIQRGFYDERKKRRAYKWVCLCYGYWRFQFNYGLINYME
jgi:hypothetical protein